MSDTGLDFAEPVSYRRQFYLQAIPVFFSQAIEKLLTPTHDKHMLAAAAGVHPQTISKILSRQLICKATLEKVGYALKHGRLAPRTASNPDPNDLPSRVHAFLLAVGSTERAAALLHISPLVLAKLTYGERVNRRFRAAVSRRLEKLALRPESAGAAKHTA